MTLKEQLAQDLKDAMKEKDAVRKNTVQFIRASILQVEKDQKITLSDEGVIEVLAKELKKRKDVLPEYEKSGRNDLIENLKREIEIIESYLPKQLSREELEEIVKQEIQNTNATSMKDIGKVMQAVLPRVKGRADGKVVNEIAKNLLS
ncbi:MAG: GatB/YqeY domain-containing protein [Clostridiaceae bacterium]|nr:GatB/YqeY domain-containing protein [Clostridiaceae bacterium]